MPVWQLAGKRAPRPLRTTFTLGADMPSAMAATAQRHAQARSIKIKLTGDLELDLARVAVAEARACERPLVAEHAWDVDAIIGDIVTALLTEKAAIAKQYEQMLDEIVDQARGDAHIEAQSRAQTGRAERVLAEASTSASLLVVGSRGRGGFTGLLLGSVSRSLITHSACPTMLVRTTPAH